MPYYKCTFLFKQGDAGWSETTYVLIEGDSGTIHNFMEGWRAARSALLGAGCQIFACRYSVTDRPGSALLRRFPVPAATSPRVPDPPELCLVAQYITADQAGSLAYFRGLPAGWVAWDAENDRVNWSGEADGKWTEFRTSIRALRARCRSTSSAARDAVGYPITGIAIDELFSGVSLKVTIPGIKAGDPIKIGGVYGGTSKTRHAVNRRTTVYKVVDANTIVTNLKSTTEEVLLLGGGRVWTYGPSYSLILDIGFGSDVHRQGVRACGPPFTSRRGRRKKRA